MFFSGPSLMSPLFLYLSIFSPFLSSFFTFSHFVLNNKLFEIYLKVFIFTDTDITEKYTRCQFHQHLMRAFCIRKLRAKLYLCLHVRFDPFLAQVYWSKCTHKMLVKLTTNKRFVLLIKDSWRSKIINVLLNEQVTGISQIDRRSGKNFKGGTVSFRDLDLR